MFASFFNKSKPINFLIVGFAMTLFYCIANFVTVPAVISVSYFFKKIGLLIIYLLLMVLMDFIVKRNRVNRRNTFAILLFALFTVWFPDILRNDEILLSGFFVLLALRRIISLKSGIDTKKKIFDAAFWICVGSLFFEWSILFLILVFLAVLFYEANDYRNWLIPIVAIATVYMLATCFFLLSSNSFFNFQQFFSEPNWKFEIGGSWHQLIPLATFSLFSIFVVIHYIFLIQHASSTMKSSMVLILAILLTSLLVILCSSTETHGETLFFIFPIAIVGANYFQADGKRLFKNVIILLIISLTLVFPFLTYVN
ncbi:MAG TPA: DUF6427 family protein [Flavobacteriaceae bacterium]|nr:DUF6427 family protein [Flavobacteriaceae bacterium]